MFGMTARSMNESATMDSSPVALISVLARYSREDYGANFLYLPIPKREADQAVWGWLQLLQSMGAASKRWTVSADHAADLLKGSHRDLFTPPPVCFEVYRLHQKGMDRVFAKL